MDAVFIEVLVILAGLGTAGFCSGASTALAELDERGRLEGIDGESSKVAEILSWWKARREAVAMVLAIGHRLGLIAAVVVGLSIAVRTLPFGPLETAVGVAVATVLAVILCDVLPATVAKRWPEWFGLQGLRVLRLPYLLLYPLVLPLVALRRTLEGEEASAADESEGSRVLLAWKQLLAPPRRATTEVPDSLREFPVTTVREVMIPRTDMVTISRDMKLDEILLILLECGHSRIPVHGETLDDIEGLFYAKDIIELMASGREFDIDEFLREPYFVPETKPISELLTEFQRQRIHLAVVVDEFGGTEGLITLEDIIEEFFGDIQDEYDVEPSQLVELSSTTVLADARIDIDEIEDHFDVELPQNGEYDSLGGFLLDQTGGVPQPGEELEWDSLMFRVMEADARRVDTVEIEQTAEPDGEPAEVA